MNRLRVLEEVRIRYDEGQVRVVRRPMKVLSNKEVGGVRTVVVENVPLEEREGDEEVGLVDDPITRRNA